MENLEITKLQYYAGLAMKEMITQFPSRTKENVAKLAYEYANAMIAEEDKQSSPHFSAEDIYTKMDKSVPK